MASDLHAMKLTLQETVTFFTQRIFICKTIKIFAGNVKNTDAFFEELSICFFQYHLDLPKRFGGASKIETN